MMKEQVGTFAEPTLMAEVSANLLHRLSTTLHSTADLAAHHDLEDAAVVVDDDVGFVAVADVLDEGGEVPKSSRPRLRAVYVVPRPIQSPDQSR